MSTTEQPLQGSSPNDTADLTLRTQQLGKYVFHDRGYGHYIITENDRLVEDSHKFTNSEVHQLYAFALEDRPTKAQMDELATVGPDGRVIEASHHPSKSQMDERCRAAGKLVRVVPVFHWTFGPGRKFGCFDARPGVSYITYVEHSFEDVKMEYNYYSQQWDTSQARVELQEHMALIIKHNDLSNVVCFGTGSLQDDHMNVRRRTCLQIAAMVTMKDCIIDEGKSVKHVTCFAQDPVYTDLDKDFLRSVGIEPVNDPEGFLSINSNSVVCDWNTYGYIIRKLSERPWPAVFISFSHQFEELSVAREANRTARNAIYSDLSAIEAQQIQDMLTDREQLPLPALIPLMYPAYQAGRDGNRLGYQRTMYWRKSSASAGQGHVNEAIGHAL